MRTKIILLLFVAVFLVFATSCGRSYYHHGYGYSQYGSHNQDPYRIGYDRGLEHGFADRRAGYDFNFAHSSDFQRGISDSPYVNDRFREGYAKGYRDGYYGSRRY